ncbi:phage tail domain-containing protein [Actinomadura madurae]|uniref:phage tail domain-containing protein n=1 Tax=Actinomadura madurae TaxID=1993 RepID=UPI0020D23BC8|nr:phage tail domain-containing protein [Actinomadura madurae]MCP9947282.1 phage tail family protein [Actinomadura madurae]MCP9964045.1 phage tail family protein [Actinomadura madurae]MCP9976519.1 phage tail family protein [Actinomadura madurae]MCQ0011983.1 phage tail family protein [Actinomadura madurae]MCQ0012716.1 phage tail family protein [Actinomadura madurae]
MPLPAGVGGGGTGPGGGLPITSRQRPLRVSYIDPDGETWDFSDLSGPVQVINVAGHGSPPVALTSLAMPSGASLPQNYTGSGRTILVAIVAGADTQADFLRLTDRLAQALWTERLGVPAPGTLVIQRPDGTGRRIKVLCTDGPDLSDDDRDKSGLTWTSFVITFKSLDPCWSDATPITLTFQGADEAAGVPPMPPVVLSPYAVLGNVTVNNTGNASAYPVWKITGPGTPTLENVTLGREFGLATELAEGETVTIDTAPDGTAYAIDQLGADRWSDLVKSSPRDLWELVKGPNQLNLALAGSSSASQIELSYVRRWLRA